MYRSQSQSVTDDDRRHSYGFDYYLTRISVIFGSYGLYNVLAYFIFV